MAIEEAVVLASAVGKLKLDSNELFVLAKKSFKEAGKQVACVIQAVHRLGSKQH